MKDSKKKSISEVITNMGISYPIHFIANYTIIPAYATEIYNAGYDFGAFTVINLQLGLWFTIVSFVRLYLLRRLYAHYGPRETGLSLIKRGIRRIRKWIIL